MHAPRQIDPTSHRAAILAACLAALSTLSHAAAAQPATGGGAAQPGRTRAEGDQPVAPPLDWRTEEKVDLEGQVQVTFPDRFIKAGESYFDHLSPPASIVFQAIPRPAEGAALDANYSMYVAALKRDAEGNITGLGEPVLVSAPGSANTCGWFHPTKPGTVIFGSTLTAPKATDAPGYSRDRQRYSWQFPTEMEIVMVGGIDRLLAAASFNAHAADQKQRHGEKSSLIPNLSTLPTADTATPLFTRPGYDAECSISPDGRFVLYTHVDPTNNDPNLWIFEPATGRHTPIITSRGYDGGPFFSPDGRLICYRSDRKGNNVLQLFVAELAFGNDGDGSMPIGIAREVQLTGEIAGKPEQEQPVSWCPYFHPSGTFLVYDTSEVSHSNYEVFAVELDLDKPREALARRRVTAATGFDGLPVFSSDAKLMMWTSQRGPKRDDEQRPSSQLWIANWKGKAPGQ
ncbi:MAG: TolB family protein [Phycisphaerales bacterium]